MMQLLAGQHTGPLIASVPFLIAVVYFGVTAVRLSLAPYLDDERTD